MKNRLLSKMISFVLVLAMVLSFGLPARASNIRWSESDMDIPLLLNGRKAEKVLQSQEYEPTDQVRVSILLKERPTAQMGFAAKNLAGNARAMAYSSRLQQKQEDLTTQISRRVLGGKKLDVVWNLTLTCNVIAANVPYSAVEQIAAMDGVRMVVVEQPHRPAVAQKEEAAGPMMATSGGMTGSHAVWQNGFTGAGRRIAVIDTGTDTDHQSFDNGAFLYALEQNAAKAGMTYEEYVDTLNLLDVEEIAQVLPYLHIYERYEGVTAEDLFVTDKLAFGFNYVDNDFNLDHDDDGQGEHGSHVAGISTANRYIPKDGGYVSALDEVMTAGVAPDAQLVTMKVFGASGGAYPSDYFAAVEDAVLLNCDSINLSLGGSEPGFGFDVLYDEVLASLENTNSVLAVASGNSGHWSMNGYAGLYGLLYADDVSFQTSGNPGTYPYAFTVASVDNSGIMGVYLKANDVYATYYESLSDPDTGVAYGTRPIASLDVSSDGAGTTYEYLMVETGGTADAFEGMDLTGKIVLCWRDGVHSFEEMALNAVEKGAVATVICNYEDEAILVALTEYGQFTDAPVVSIIATEANAIQEASEAHVTEGGLNYYTGQMLIKDGVQVAPSGAGYEMSWFSSWGVPGNLTLKPEITAPGGNIYSVFGSTPSGGGSDQYVLMSGTSMATPQVSGLVALLMQYLNETGLSGHMGMTDRALAHSLLMSTAVPVREEAADGNYYAVMQQGAGMARVDLAMKANSFVLVDGQVDGKVKAELGDDPQRSGVYTFTFTLNNLTDRAQEYTLRADMFTQAVVYDEEMQAWFQDTSTTMLDSLCSFTVDGQPVTQVTVPADGKLSVEVKLELTDDAKAYLADNHPKGSYIEAYVYAEEQESGVAHSIPVLGYYGSWTEPSMFEVGSYLESQYGTDTRNSYTGMLSNYLTLLTERGGELYYWGGNPYAQEDEYLPERNAFNNASGQAIEEFIFTLIRNAVDAKMVISNRDTGEVYYQEDLGEVTSAYFNDYIYSWDNDVYALYPHWLGTDLEGNYLPEGTNVEISLVAAPEYYLQADGTVAWDQLGEGAYQNYYLTIDNTAPVLSDLQLDPDTGDFLQMTAEDNHYIAAVSLLNADGSRVLATMAANQTVAGEEMELELDLSQVYGSGEFLVVVYDYAMNHTVYNVELDLGIIEDRPHFTAFNFSDDNVWSGIGLEGDSRVLSSIPGNIGSPLMAEFVDGYVYVVTDRLNLYVCEDSTLGDMIFVRNLDPKGELGIGFLWDMAYNYQDGKLYFTYYGPSWERPTMSSIDLYTGEVTEEGLLPADLINLAIDDEGNCYGVEWVLGGSAGLYRYTLEDLDTSKATLIGQTGLYVSGWNSMAWDHDNDKLYWSCGQNGLYEVSTETGELTMVFPNDDYYLGLFVRPAEYDAHRFDPTDEIMGLEIAGPNTVVKNNQATAQATVYPWNASNRDVIWTSSDVSIATVDENGVVTGISAGSVTITATSAADETVFDSMEFTVTALDQELYTFLRDEEDVTHWGSFNVSDALDVATSFQTDLNIISATWGPGGKLYAATVNEKEDGWTSDLYTINTVSGVATWIGESEVYYTDMAYSPTFNAILAVCENYVLVIDHTTGNYRGGWYWSDTMLAGITHYYSGYNSTYGTEEDQFLIVDANGNVYIESLIDFEGQYEILYGPGDIYGQVTDVTDDLCVSSAYYDGSRWMYWTTYNAVDDRTYLYAWDSYNDATFTLGVYDEGVAPMALLEVRNLCPTGDADRDGEVTVNDVTLIMSYAAELEDAEALIDLIAADVDGDGEVTTNDANLVLLFCMGMINQFPAG